ncbi:TPA: accessory Sec system protein translocase subunit SecY2 [Streptococcus suis]
MKKIQPGIRKLAVTAGIIMLFLLGRSIPLPFLQLDAYINPEEVNSFNLAQISLFSLGLGPWMNATILLSLFTRRKSASESPRMAEYRKNALMLLIAVIQGLGIAVSFSYTGSGSQLYQSIAGVTLVSVAGAFVISWLISLNSNFGVGGSAMLVLVNILVGQLVTIPKVMELSGTYLTPYLWFGLLWILVTIYLIVVFEKAEYRIPVQRITINNTLADEAYMPVKIFLSGGMSFMYSYTLFSFPQYVLVLLAYFFPQHGTIIKALGRYFSMLEWEGMVVFLLILYGLTVSFAYINLNPTDKAEELRKSGDYIPGVRPGKPTKQYLSKIASRLGNFNAFYLVVMSGIPMGISMIYPELRPIANLPGVVMMTASIFLTIIIEFRVMRLKKRYTPLFK